MNSGLDLAAFLLHRISLAPKLGTFCAIVRRVLVVSLVGNSFKIPEKALEIGSNRFKLRNSIFFSNYGF